MAKNKPATISDVERIVGAYAEDIQEKLDIVIEGQMTLRERLDRLEAQVGRIEERMDRLETDIAWIKSEIREIRQELRKKVSREEFLVLHRRVTKLEKTVATH